MGIRAAILGLLGSETRSEHCKFYSEPTLKKAIESFQAHEGFTSFSDAVRSALLDSPAIQHEIRVLKDAV